LEGPPISADLDRELEFVRDLTRVAARAAASKGGEDTVVLEVGAVLAICDAFILTSGRNHRQVATIAEEVEAQVKAAGGRSPLRIEGRDTAEWVLLDFGDFVVHVFLEETRRFYDIERLWRDAPRLEWEEARAK
jgi:ribosome-associated protein